MKARTTYTSMWLYFSRPGRTSTSPALPGLFPMRTAYATEGAFIPHALKREMTWRGSALDGRRVMDARGGRKKRQSAAPAGVERQAHRLGAVGDAKLAVDALEMNLDGHLLEAQLVGDLAVGGAAHQA